jgi:hypothetical protein
VDVVRCAHCDEVIGVWEPAWVVVGDATELKGSLLRLRTELEKPGSMALHECCHSALKMDRGQD